MDKNFKVRTIITVAMFTVALIGLYTFDSIPFKIIFGFFTTMGAVELLSFFKRKRTVATVVLALMELAFLVCGTVFVARIDVWHFWYIMLGVPGYDIFAYLFGKMFGGKIFKKSRPFPKISKNKTWEGTALGLLMSVTMVGIMMAVRQDFVADWMYLFCGPLALTGDLFESYLKRKFGVKDSNEILIRHKFWRGVETLVGGSEGHGGYLDRVDSTVFTGTILLLISLIVASL